MKRLLLILPVVLLVFTTCRNMPVDYDESAAELGVYIKTPAPPVATRAGDNEVPANPEEYAVNNILLWIFNHDTKEKICSLSVSGSQLPLPGKVRRYGFKVSRDIAITLPKVDVFAIANTASVSSDLSLESTWDEVYGATFSNPHFGLGLLTRSVPDEGLPMTGTLLDQSIVGEAPELRVEHNITLVRAVSKIRFVFCRMTDNISGHQDDVAINWISLSENIIPDTEYLFTENNCRIGDTYNSTPVNIDGASHLAENDEPEKLTYITGMTALAYENAIQDAIEANKLTDLGTLYLRESDMRINGRIVYTINGEQYYPGKSFSMLDAGGFARNHSWTVYGYFLSNRNMQLSVLAQDWDYGKWDVDFESDAVDATQLSLVSSPNVTSSTSGKVTTVRIGSGGTAICKCSVYSPKGGRLMINPIGDAEYFQVLPETADINSENPEIVITIRRKQGVTDWTGKSISLSFCVELGEREIDANSEILPDGSQFIFVL